MASALYYCPKCNAKHVIHEGNKIQCQCGCKFEIFTVLIKPTSEEQSMNVKVIKNVDKPETTEILAEAIVRIGESMEKLNRNGLNRKAIVVLLKEETGLGKGVIETVLDAMPRLAGWYCRK